MSGGGDRRDRRRLAGVAALACAACCAPLLPAAAVVVGVGGAVAAVAVSGASMVRRGSRADDEPDHDAPIACTLAPDEIPARLELLGRLRDAATSVTRTERGLCLVFPDDPIVVADVELFAVEELRCCTFWQFSIDEGDGGDGIELSWDGPPEAAGLLDELHAALTGDEPIGSLGGLL